MQQIVLGDPGQGTLPFTLPSDLAGRGPLLILNESPYGLNFYFGGQPYLVPAESFRQFDPRYLETGLVRWEIAYTLSVGNSPISMVVVEAYACGEEPQTTISPLPRQTNIGNGSLSVTNVQTVVNDGSVAPTQVIEATPSGAASSQLVWANDGSGKFGGGLVVVSAAGVFTSIPTGAIPGTAISGVVPSASSLNQQITSLDNGTAQLHSTVNARGIALGYNDAGGVYHQVLGVSGAGVVTVVNGAIPLAGLGTGTLPAGVALATGANLPGGTLGASVDGDILDAGTNKPNVYIKAGAGGAFRFQIPSGTTVAAINSAGQYSGQAASVPASGVAAGTLPSGVALTALSSDSGAITSDGAGNATVATLTQNGVVFSLGAGAVSTHAVIQYYAAGLALQIKTPTSGSANGVEIATWDGAAQHIPLGVGTAASSAQSYFSDNGDLYTRRITPAYSGSLAGINRISGSASATVTHGLTTTPDAAVINTNNGSNSTTFGSGSYTATTVFIYEFSAQAWVGLVYVH